MHYVLIAAVVLIVVTIASAVIAAVLLTRKRPETCARATVRSTPRSPIGPPPPSPHCKPERCPPGPAKEVAELRHDLRRSRDSTARLLAAAPARSANFPTGHTS
jgi:hypothetical protein